MNHNSRLTLQGGSLKENTVLYKLVVIGQILLLYSLLEASWEGSPFLSCPLMKVKLCDPTFVHPGNQSIHSGRHTAPREEKDKNGHTGWLQLVLVDIERRLKRKNNKNTYTYYFSLYKVFPHLNFYKPPLRKVLLEENRNKAQGCCLYLLTAWWFRFKILREGSVKKD